MSARAILERGAITHQERVRKLEDDSTLVRAYHPGMVLGPLQCEGYARAIFARRTDRPAAEVDRLVAHRMRRGDAVRDPARRWELIHTEGALSWGLGSAALMAEQMEHLIEVSRSSHVRIGVVPARTIAGFTAHHGFHLFDSAAVEIGTYSATALLSAPEDITDYVHLFERVRSVAVFDDDARAVLARLSACYRGDCG